MVGFLPKPVDLDYPARLLQAPADNNGPESEQDPLIPLSNGNGRIPVSNGDEQVQPDTLPPHIRNQLSRLALAVAAIHLS